jgi:hypothetical protein
MVAAALVLAGALPGRATLAREIVGGEEHDVYLPLIKKYTVLPANLANGSFEIETWFSDKPGNQHPTGWTFYSPAQGVTMPFPTKMQQGSSVPAISNGPGEYVHKLANQLPDDERVGGSRALILEGDQTYKAFGAAGPHALVLSQTITGTVGEYLRVTVFIVGETHDGLPLEDDHFVAAVRLGNVEDKRLYADMIHNFDVPGNERAWNRFEVIALVPGSGQLTLSVIVQQNWWGRVDFFMDNFRAEHILDGP